MEVRELPTPSLLVDQSKVISNCNKMLESTATASIKLRCQTKTHKTVEGAELQTGGSKSSLVCSTLAECEFYADHGFDDILYGSSLMEFHMARNFNLCQRLKEYHVMIANQQGLDVLKSYPPPDSKKWSVFVKVDCGYQRVGIPSRNLDLINPMIKEMMDHGDKINFQGFYAHCGNSYGAASVEEVKQARDNAINEILNLANSVESHLGIKVKNIGTGSTPSCSHFDIGFGKLTEIHPGNYIFYDLQQMMLGSCKFEDIACRVLTRVIAHSHATNELRIDAGFLGLSQQGFNELGGTYGIIKDHPDLMVSKVTQEVGFVRSKDPNLSLDFNKYPVGTLFEIYQYHSCDLASKHPKYFVTDVNGKVIREWSPVRGW